MKYIIYLFFIFLIYQNNKYIYRNLLYLFGFKIDLNSIEKLPSKVILISTHTSIYDFFIGLLIYYGYMHHKYDNYILMKKNYEKFTNPLFYFIDKKLQLIKVEKNKNGLINKILTQIRYKDNYLLYLSPEGTRACVDNLRTGYWVIAQELNLDVCYIGVDFYKKTITFEDCRKVEKYWDDEKVKFKECAVKYKPLFAENCYFYNKDKIE